MRKFFLSLFLLTTHLFSVPVTSPEFLIADCVNAVTGNYFVAETDLIVNSAQPYPITRIFSEEKGWEFFPHIRLLETEQLEKGKKHPKKLRTADSNGLSFHLKSTLRTPGKFRFDPNSCQQGLVNTSQGEISGRTNLYNLKGLHITKHDVYEILFGDGTKRVYVKVPNKVRKFDVGRLGPEQEMVKCRHFQLRREELPNGKHIHYKYDKNNRLSNIQITDQTRTHIYSWLLIKYPKDKMSIQTSDKQQITYHFKDDFLTKITSPHIPDETITYAPNEITRQIERDGPFTKVKLEGGLQVKQLFTPASNAPRYTFQQAPGHMRVTDTIGYSTSYSWTVQGYPYEILYHDKSRERYLHTSQGDLIAHLTFNPDGNCIKALTYAYDNQHNVISETLFGNLSGYESQPIFITPEGLPSETPSVTTHYLYNERNLPTRIEEPSGKITLIHYLENSNLPKARFTCNGDAITLREFTFYDKFSNPIKKIQDDGTSEDHRDLSGITTRIITRIELVQEGLGLHLPKSVEEHYYDPNTYKEVLLKKSHFTYNARCQITSKEIVDAEKQSRYRLSYFYDKRGNLIEESDPSGETIYYQYDNLNRCIKKTEPAINLTTEYEYNQAGQLIETRENETRSSKYTYNFVGELHSATDPYDIVTHYRYDSRGNCVVNNNFVATIHTTYDSQHNPTQVIDARGEKTSFKYNVRGQVSHIHHPDNTRESFSYSPDGNLIAYTDPESRLLTTTYDYQGRPLVKTLYSKTGQLLSTETNTYSALHNLMHIDQGGRTTTYAYNGAGQKTSETFLDKKRSYTYDPLGRLAQVAQNDQIRTYQYDNKNQLIQTAEIDPTGNLYAETSYTYDGHGNQATITQNGHTTHYTYDPFNRLISHTDPIGHTTTTTYDKLTKTVVNALGQTTVQNYNEAGHLVSASYYGPNNNLLHKEENKCDPAGNLLTQTLTIFDPEGDSRQNTLTFTYDSRSRLLSQTEADQKTTRYTYTEGGKQHQIIKPDQSIIETLYDAKGRKRAILANNIYYRFTYDNLDRCILAEDLIANTATHRSYDLYDNLTQETLANGQTLTSTYKNRRRTTLTLPDNRTVHYSYDPYHLTSITFNNYTHSYNSYQNHKPVKQTFIADLGSQTHTYDALSRETHRTNPYQTETHNFDPVGNLLSRTLDNKTDNYSYNHLNQLTAENTDSYSYDSLHNRLTKNDDQYTITELNQIASTNTLDLTYDPNGNPTEKTTPEKNIQYSYDAFDRLITVETETASIHYTYDPWHRRISQQYVTPNQEHPPEHYLYDYNNEIGLVQNDQITQLRILGLGHGAEIGASILIELNNKTYLPLHTLSGDISALINPATKQPHEAYHYTAFGEHTPSQNPWRYKSKRTDPETGFTFFGRRYYDPNLGRFLTPDPKGYSEGPNLYSYLNNNPLTQFDFYGLAIDRGGVIDPSATSRVLTHARNAAGGIAHGAIDLIGGLAKFPCVTANAIYSVPGALTNLAQGESPFKDFTERHANIDLCFDVATEFVTSYIPADVDSKVYQYSRTGTRITGEAAMLATGVGVAYKGFQAARAGSAACTEYYAIANQSGRKILKTSSAEIKIANKFAQSENRAIHALASKNRSIANKISGYTKHGLNQAIGRDGGRGVNPTAILDAIKFPQQIIQQKGELVKYMGKDAVVILNSEGKIVTTFGKVRGPQIWNKSGIARSIEPMRNK